MYALIVTHGLTAATAAQHGELCRELGPAIAAVGGLVSMTRLENGAAARYGAVYVFTSKRGFDGFVVSELFEALYAHTAVLDMAASDFAIAHQVAGDRNGAAKTSRPRRSSR